MNKILKILFMTFSILSLCQAQEFSDFGLKMGMVSSKFEQKLLREDGGTVSIFNERRIGPTMGVYYKLIRSSFLNVETEIYYLQKGGNEKIAITTVSQPEGTGESIIFDLQFDYLQLQANIQPFVSVDQFNIYGILGLSLDYLLAVKSSMHPRNDFNDFVFGYSIGLGIDSQRFLNNLLLLEFLINSDFTNIYESSNIEYKNSVYLVRMGVGL